MNPGTLYGCSYAIRMHGERTPAWWSARILLATGIGSVVVGLLFIVDALLPAAAAGTIDVRSGAGIAVYGGAVLAMLGGLVWMIRIFRGPRDEPPPWRYRSK